MVGPAQFTAYKTAYNVSMNWQWKPVRFRARLDVNTLRSRLSVDVSLGPLYAFAIPTRRARLDTMKM